MVSTYHVWDKQEQRVTVTVRTPYNWYILGSDARLYDWLEPECSIWANIMKTKGLM